MLRCKACEIMRNEAYFLYAAVKHDERNAANILFYLLPLFEAVQQFCPLGSKAYGKCLRHVQVPLTHERETLKNGSITKTVGT